MVLSLNDGILINTSARVNDNANIYRQCGLTVSKWPDRLTRVVEVRETLPGRQVHVQMVTAEYISVREVGGRYYDYGLHRLGLN